jgi:hypothetical protein
MGLVSLSIASLWEACNAVTWHMSRLLVTLFGFHCIQLEVNISVFATVIVYGLV